VCLLTAFRRDERCPLCRAVPIEAQAPSPDANTVRLELSFAQVEEHWAIAEAHERAMRNYTRRTRRLALRDEPLMRLHSVMQERQRESRAADVAGDREWVRTQDAAWRSAEMVLLRENERRARRRYLDARRRYDATVALRIGPPPVPEWTLSGYDHKSAAVESPPAPTWTLRVAAAGVEVAVTEYPEGAAAEPPPAPAASHN